jgi:hypothetical protein
MMTRRSLEGALKCAFRDFRREEATAVHPILVSIFVPIPGLWIKQPPC